MVVEEGLDTGGIFARAEVRHRPRRHPRGAAGAAGGGGHRAPRRRAATRARARPSRRTGEPTYAAKIDPAERELDWSAPGRRRPPARARRRRVDDPPRAPAQGPRARTCPRAATARSCAAGDGPVELVEVQPEGKARESTPRRGPHGARWAARRAACRRDGVTGSALGPRAGARRARPHRPGRCLRQPRCCRSCWLAAAWPNADRHFATELVYGTTRMRRACDLLVDRFLTRTVDPTVRNALRLGAYQLHFLGMPPHAAVGETVEVAPRRGARPRERGAAPRGRRTTVVWPDEATRLSYPDWVVDRLTRGPRRGRRPRPRSRR